MGINFHNYDRKIELESASIMERCSKENQELIFEYDKRYTIKNDLSKGRRLTLLAKLKLISIRATKPLADMTARDIEDLELKLLDMGISQRSVDDYRIIIKQFYRWLDNEQGERWEWIKRNLNRKAKHKKYNANDFMNEQERQSFMNAAKTPLERAIAAIFLTSGCRAGEVGSMSVGSVEFLNDKSCLLTINGKTGERRIKLFEPTSTYLMEWMKIHARRNEHDAPFWINHYGDALSYNGIANILKRLGKRVGIKKPLNPHSFRHMTYTMFQLKGVPQALRERYFGHVHGSSMARIYTHASDDDLFNYLDGMHNIMDSNHKRNVKLELEMKQCTKCLKTFMPHESFCNICNISLEKSIREQQDNRKAMEEHAQKMVNGESDNDQLALLRNQVLAMAKEIEQLKIVKN